MLERIVTDRGYDVATQIEALRDQRRVEEQLEQLEDEEPGVMDGDLQLDRGSLAGDLLLHVDG